MVPSHHPPPVPWSSASAGYTWHRARTDILAFTAFPKTIWRQIWSNNPQERLNHEMRRRTDVCRDLPPTASPWSVWSAPSWPSSRTS